MSENLVEVKHLQQYFPAGGMGKNKQYVQAVDDVSFAIRKGETLGLVGESGCGKTTTGRTLLRLYEPTDGTIIYDGKVLFDKKEKIAVDMLPYRRRMQIVFQDPYASLDPRMTIGDIVGEGIDIHHLCANAKERHDKIISLLERVGLNSEHANRYPHEFSGGQRQRVGIARALAVDPEFIVCDEPVSALDVSIQAQVVNMFEDLQQEMGLTYLFIAHDLSVVKHISNRIGVMYLGKLVELADSFELIAHSVHPYTRSLISAIPVADPVTARQSHRIVLQGDVPSPLNPPSGCRFRTRCPYADERCAAEVPEFKKVSSGHWAACHHLDKVKYCRGALPGVADTVCPPLDSTRHINSYLYRAAHRSRLVLDPKMCVQGKHSSTEHRIVRGRNTKGLSIKTVTKVTDHLKFRIQSGKV